MLALVDNTVLSNFALAGAILILHEALGNDAATTHAVLDEFATGIALGRLPATDVTWLKVLALDVDEGSVYHSFRPQLGAGEAACLAVALRRGYSVLTDDRTARKVATQLLTSDSSAWSNPLSRRYRSNTRATSS